MHKQQARRRRLNAHEEDLVTAGWQRFGKNWRRSKRRSSNRAMCERIFGVRRRRALQLMHSFGGWQSGQAYLVDRRTLLKQLEPFQDGAELVMEQCRRQRLSETLDQTRRHRTAAQVTLPVAQDASRRTMLDLPARSALAARQIDSGIYSSGGLAGAVVRTVAGSGSGLRWFPPHNIGLRDTCSAVRQRQGFPVPPFCGMCSTGSCIGTRGHSHKSTV